jgi:hypothetical protein
MPFITMSKSKMFFCGLLLVAIASLLFTLFGRAYLGGGRQGPINLDELYFWAQWTGFWLLLASLVLFGLDAWMHGLVLRSWRMTPPLLAILLATHFIIWTMPEKSNQANWAQGALGIRVYLSTKLAVRTEAREAARLLAAFAGRWQGVDGEQLVIGADNAQMITDKGQQEIGEGGSVEAGRRFYSNEPRARLDYLAATIGLDPRPLPSPAADGTYLMLYITSKDRDAYFLLLAPGRMLARIDDGPRGIFLRAAP